VKVVLKSEDGLYMHRVWIVGSARTFIELDDVGMIHLKMGTVTELAHMKRDAAQKRKHDVSCSSQRVQPHAHRTRAQQLRQVPFPTPAALAHSACALVSVFVMYRTFCMTLISLRS
jgi:hypothetical protein